MYLVYPLLIFLAALEKLETKDFGNVDKKMNNETESRLENFDNEGDIRVPRKIGGVQIIQQLLNQRVSNMLTEKFEKAAGRKLFYSQVAPQNLCTRVSTGTQKPDPTLHLYLRVEPDPKPDPKPAGTLRYYFEIQSNRSPRFITRIKAQTCTKPENRNDV